MIKTLAYVVIILIGFCISPFIIGNTGYIYIAAGDYQIETSLVFGLLGLILFYAALQIVEWLIIFLLNIIIHSRYLPDRWRKQAAKKHTLQGALALAEEDWPSAEKAMSKGAAKGELPALNLFAAARAAHHQHNSQARDQYLAQAAEDPLAQTAARTSKTRYLIQQGQLAEARIELQLLNPTSKSKTPVLKLALDLYQLQGDWQALKLLLPAIKKRQIVTDEIFNNIEQQTNIALLTAATESNEQDLEKCWHWLSKTERSQPTLIAIYARGLCQYERKKDALKLLSKSLKVEPSNSILSALPHILDADDDEIRKLLQRYQQTHEHDAGYQVCLAKLAMQKRDTKVAKEHWTKVCDVSPLRQHWLALAQVQEQLGENTAALQSYRKAANASE
ncbi:heme biosynthesis HemY N-terminal domain-containing protein [Shewanella sp. 5_MG-2023]|uniref:heme biosynthesis HemY N-terminal domain-containing protein n=1 Tax=Shewanella sp. 5_MG-2023 TaxID=3062656 RepID=UPI0026E3E4FA|nr:heme biosynthesis HemY N-terminal domain-containing protein [Shewanella sp. 5_MG-2023]MDO6641315.1 heme biosynthesis HemY N-terminal domain-containing protein [Shewanella sp. 5_MG-2023]